MIIYKIANLVNGKVYIGQTVQKNPKMRWYSHDAKARTGVINPLYCSMRKHGSDKFSWEVIDSANSLEELNELEIKWLAHYRALGPVYNNREAGNNKIHSEESIEKMRASQRAAHARRRAANGGKEKHCGPRIDGGAMKGKRHSIETRLKMSESAYKRGS